MNSISNLLAEFKFVGKISKMGNNKVIWIPKEYHDQITDLEGKQVRIVIDDKIWKEVINQIIYNLLLSGGTLRKND